MPGPLREIHAGSGYWSQDSVVQVMSLASSPKRLEVRWPGGRTATIELPANSSEVTINIDGQIRTLR
jgi:hypothetical protein